MIMREITRRAQVSLRTVSRVIDNEGEITEAARQRVLVEGCDVFFCNPSEDELRALDSRTDPIVDGIIVSPCPGLAPERIEPHAERFHPIVAIGHPIADPRIKRR
jgi:DNA-binding LacI/PurR family transcriptional regulator